MVSPKIAKALLHQMNLPPEYLQLHSHHKRHTALLNALSLNKNSINETINLFTFCQITYQIDEFI